jgi:hypothetical protein
MSSEHAGKQDLVSGLRRLPHQNKALFGKTDSWDLKK